MLKDDSPSVPADPTQNFTVEARESVVLTPQSPAMTAAVCIAAFLIPGFGHLLLKRWIRGTLLFGSIVLMFIIGLGMQGQLHRLETTQLVSFNTLKWFANVGVGIPYLIALKMGVGGGGPTSQTFDYGWAYLLVTGLMNYLVVLDAFDVAQGRKP
jgi:hypothetical protein